MRHFTNTLILVAGLGLAAGCSDEPQQPPPPQPADQPGGGESGTTPGENAAPTPAPDPAADDEEEYSRPEYPDSNRRNPFQPDPDVVQPQGTVDDGRARQLDPLEQYGVGELSLAAIISEVAIPKAMFLDPDGFGHVVKEGDRIGRNGAVISDIRDNEVEITETPNPEEGGQATSRVVKLTDRQISSSDETLSDEEREALRKLLQSEEGMRALREQASDQGGTTPPEGNRTINQDPRFRGFAPPSQGEE